MTGLQGPDLGKVTIAVGIENMLMNLMMKQIYFTLPQYPKIMFPRRSLIKLIGIFAVRREKSCVEYSGFEKHDQSYKYFLSWFSWLLIKKNSGVAHVGDINQCFSWLQDTVVGICYTDIWCHDPGDYSHWLPVSGWQGEDYPALLNPQHVFDIYDWSIISLDVEKSVVHYLCSFSVFFFLHDSQKHWWTWMSSVSYYKSIFLLLFPWKIQHKTCARWFVWCVLLSQPSEANNNAVVCVSVSMPFIIMTIMFRPYQRGIYCDDESIRYPYRPDTISHKMMAAVTISCSIIIVSLHQSDSWTNL